MRFFEILLILVVALTFILLLTPKLRSRSWTKCVPIAGVLAAVVQILVEGARWQVIPAYFLALLFVLISFLVPRIRHLKLKRWVAISGAIVGVGLTGFILLTAIALPIFMPVFSFPKPTGPYAIGTVTYHWTDASRPELFTADPNDHRELMAQVWYPADTASKGRRAAYIDHADAWAKDTGHVLGLPPILLSHFKYVTTNAVEAAPIAGGQSRFPVLIYQTGSGGSRSISTFQIEELVSHGYIVVGLDQPGVASSITYPNGKHIAGWTKAEADPFIYQAIWPKAEAPVLNGTALPDGITPYFGEDASFALDQLIRLDKNDEKHIFANRLDLEKVGTFGVSLGGIGVAEACAKDLRFKACLIMDVYIPEKIVKTGLTQPTMFITRDAATMRLERERSGGWTEEDIASTIGTMQSIYDTLPGNGYYIEIPKMFHVNFTDVPYWIVPSTQIGLTGPINARRGFDIINACSLAFFDKELKGKPSATLNADSQPYPGTILKMKTGR